MKFREYLNQKDSVGLGLEPNGQEAYTWLMSKYHGSADSFLADVEKPGFPEWLARKFATHEAGEVIAAVKDALGVQSNSPYSHSDG